MNFNKRNTIASPGQSIPLYEDSPARLPVKQSRHEPTSPFGRGIAEEINFKVVVRIRPPLEREIEAGDYVQTTQVANDAKAMTIYEFYTTEGLDANNVQDFIENSNMYTNHNFTFDRVFDQQSSQTDVYDHTAKPAVLSVLQGYNATLLAYGQTGTGKTYTMEGFKYNSEDEQRGIVPRSMEEIFKYIENIKNSNTTFMVRVSYLQIYNENISDLLRNDRTNLIIREDKKKGVFVEGLTEWAVRSPHEIYSLIEKGALSRATAATKMNDVSSRSHAVFIIIVEQMTVTVDPRTGEESKEIRVGKLNLVDLAGSERVRVTGATGQRLEESKKINQSLSALGNVISALADVKQSRTHIPYRDSKITRLLEDSLGGNCITTMMAMLSPALENFSESLSTLKFANRAKNIKNTPVVNEDLDQKALLRKYELELQRLRAELEIHNRNLAENKGNYSAAELKKAEMDRAAAFEALEAQSKEFNMEKEEKKKLEEKIKGMNSQMLQGGKKVEDTPQFRNALEEQQKVIRQQYERKLVDLEKERQMIEEDKAQVDRYKQLLLKQRDIMIALTTRLNERDETIIQFQDDLDAYEVSNRESEVLLELRDRRITALEEALRKNNIPLPQEINEDLDSPDILRGINNKDASPGLPREPVHVVNELSKKPERHDEKLRAAEEEVQKLKKLLKQKDDEVKEIKFLKSPVSTPKPKEENLKDIKTNVDGIIKSLSSQDDPQQLQNVARDLLKLQKLVNSAFTGQPSQSTSQSQSRTTGLDMVQSPTVKDTMGSPDVSSSVKKVTTSTVEQPRVVKTVPASDKTSKSKADEYIKENKETIRREEDKERDIPHEKQKPVEIRNQNKPETKSVSDSTKSTDSKPEPKKAYPSMGIFGKYMGNLMTLDSDKKGDNVNKAQKEQPSKEQPASQLQAQSHAWMHMQNQAKMQNTNAKK